jgi:hypothetical protein
MKPNPPGNHDATPAPNGWYVSESTQKYDGQNRLIRSYSIGPKEQPDPSAGSAWTRGCRTEGSGFLTQIGYQEDQAGRVQKWRVWTNYPPPAL